MKIRRVEQIKGLPRQTGNRRISRRISFARFQRARFALCRIVYYRPSPGYTPAIEWRGNGRDLDARNLLALIPFMSRSKVNPRAARTWSFEKITKGGGWERERLTGSTLQIPIAFVISAIVLLYAQQLVRRLYRG